MLRTVLVDDEPLALERLQVFFGDIPGAEVVGTARDGRKAAELIARLKPDLAILDIQMPEQNGLRVAATLGDGDEKPEIVFVTAFEQYAPDAFEVEAADYLLKPVRFDRLWQAVERARRRKYLRNMAGRAEALEQAEPASSPHEDGLWVPTRSGAVFVPIETIDWIEAQRDYVMLHTATRSHIVRMSMRALEEKLDPGQLVRVHRSAFARPSNVVEVQRMGKTINALVLRDGAIVQVGPNYSKTLAERLKLAS
ncbi:MAG: two-component system, LytTR family, response regulator [Sphingomonadales bacterium]|jgi:DNA-binding LytR/AlgR family response regulator|nr:two-component system, LytTR family, response regulator [Sphingomonadales bacterium]